MKGTNVKPGKKNRKVLESRQQGMSATHKSSKTGKIINPAAYRMPGSMKQKQ